MNPEAETVIETEKAQTLREKGLTTLQVYDFAGDGVRDYSRKAGFNAKVVASAALIGFRQLPAEAQMALINDVNVKRLESLSGN